MVNSRRVFGIFIQLLVMPNAMTTFNDHTRILIALPKIDFKINQRHLERDYTRIWKRVVCSVLYSTSAAYAWHFNTSGEKANAVILFGI